MSVGAKGVISVASNVIPAEVKSMVDSALGNDFHSAAQVHEKYYPLFTTLFIESNPVPVKEVMKVMGIITDDQVRLPLSTLDEANRKILFSVTQSTGLTSH